MSYQKRMSRLFLGYWVVTGLLLGCYLVVTGLFRLFFIVESTLLVYQNTPLEIIVPIALKYQFYLCGHFIFQIYELPNLESLAIYGNDQKSLPLSFGTFRKFKKFKLTNTGISAIPQTMFYCIDLEILELEGNSFEVLPFWIAKLKKLQTLSRYHNFLERNINETCFRWQGKAKERLESPKSLAMLSAIIAMIAFPKTVCNQGLPIEVPLNLANLLASLRFCDNCSKALPNECKSIITNSAVLYANLANKAQNNW